ncbi:peptidoglycan-binding domain-containing protein [uncultured Cohaesibacter sp.]|uniref:peptidoglycan-binding domain-containing protein n=1 Tax=uncultured Cohaesibacter sp. TaxID=1002546 RepID=UPI0029C72456|nr:peptidoglycan-binding domain-containing protein [uncultured Cohaesibacter sp.]
MNWRIHLVTGLSLAATGLFALSSGGLWAEPDPAFSGAGSDAGNTISVSTQGTVSRVDDPGSVLHGPTLITSGFSGIAAYGISGETESDQVAHLFIDLDGASATFVSINDFGAGFDGREIKRTPYRKLLAKDIGQVFGMALDDAERPNLYLAASSAYGLPIVGRDRNGDRVPDKLYTGRSDAQFMDGLFGSVNDNGPGSIWKVDGATGRISRFASIKLDNVANSGPALGNIAFDGKSRQLFVSDRDTGMIFRLDLDGHVLESYDHGTIARTVVGMKPVHFDTRNRLDITVPSFDVEDPTTWHYAKEGRRVWAVAVEDGRLYYSVAEGPSVWSVGIDPEDGNFKLDARQELTLEASRRGMEISDIEFGPDGSLILAQRGAQQGSYDFSRLARSRLADVLRFRKTDEGRWRADPVAYAVGFAAQKKNSTGGLALGPGYDAKGELVADRCRETLWTSGEQLRDDASLADKLRESGALKVDGVQAQPLLALPDSSRPPWKSYFIDYDGAYPGVVESGHIGDVEVFGCEGLADTKAPEQVAPATKAQVETIIPRSAEPRLISETGLDIKKEQVGDCRGDTAGRNYNCDFRLTITNKGASQYSGPLVITDEFQRPHPTAMVLVDGKEWRCSQPSSNYLVCLHEAFTLEAGQSRSLTMSLRIPAQVRENRFYNCALLGHKSVFRQKVTVAQLSLEAAGIRSGGVDGLVGPSTRRGLRLLQAQLGMRATGEMNDQLLRMLGLPMADANTASCVSTLLPAMPFTGAGTPSETSSPDNAKPPVLLTPPSSQREQPSEPRVIPAEPENDAICDWDTTVQRGDSCACRFDGMRKISPGRCACRRGASFVAGKGCVFEEPQDFCDADSTERKGRSCFCRYPGMNRVNSRTCACGPGEDLVKGKGCVPKRPAKPRPPQQGPSCDRETALIYNGRCECRYPLHVQDIATGLCLQQSQCGSGAWTGLRLAQRAAVSVTGSEVSARRDTSL